MKPIKLFWYREASGEGNFGDDLAPIIVERLSGRSVQHASIKQCELVAIGSVLDQAISFTWKRFKRAPFRRTHVWGTGSFGNISPGYHHFKFAAVRGPHTRNALGLPSSLPLGDPGLLLSRLIDRPTKKYRWGIIPHVIHRKDAAIIELARQPGARLIDLGTPDPLATAREIASCDFVISSSLHGIIAADSFGIPNIWMQGVSDLIGGQWKFHDYFASVDRVIQEPVFPPASLRSIEAAASMARPDNISTISDKLELNFPDIR